MVAVAIDMGSGFTPGTPQTLFEGPYVPTAFSFPFSILLCQPRRPAVPDACACHVANGRSHTGATQINVVLNWTEELKRLVPTDN